MKADEKTIYDTPTAVCISQKFSVAEAVAELRKMSGVKNFEGDGPATETSVSYKDRNSKVLPVEFWEALRCLVDLQELNLNGCRQLEALPEGTLSHLTGRALRWA